MPAGDGGSGSAGHRFPAATSTWRPAGMSPRRRSSESAFAQTSEEQSGLDRRARRYPAHRLRGPRGVWDHRRRHRPDGQRESRRPMTMTMPSDERMDEYEQYDLCARLDRALPTGQGCQAAPARRMGPQLHAHVQPLERQRNPPGLRREGLGDLPDHPEPDRLDDRPEDPIRCLPGGRIPTRNSPISSRRSVTTWSSCSALCGRHRPGSVSSRSSCGIRPSVAPASSKRCGTPAWTAGWATWPCNGGIRGRSTPTPKRPPWRIWPICSRSTA